MEYKLTEYRLNELTTRFSYHAPKGSQVKRYHKIRDNFLTLAITLSNQCPEGIELSYAITKLEESCMWANAAIARRE